MDIIFVTNIYPMNITLIMVFVMEFLGSGFTIPITP